MKFIQNTYIKVVSAWFIFAFIALQAQAAVFFEFNSSSYGDTEGNGSNVPGVVVGGGVLLATSTVTVTNLMTGTANLTDDYIYGTSTVEIPAGDYTSSTFTSFITGLSIIDDSIDEIDETINFGLSSSTSTLVVGDVDGDTATTSVSVYTISDDDSAGVGIATSTTSITEGSVGETYTVVLNSEPAATTTIEIFSLGSATTTPALLTFTPDDYDTLQTVTVTVPDTTMYEGDATSTITHAASSTDMGYDGIAINSIIFNVFDDEPAPSVDPIETFGDTDVEEGGLTDELDFVLGSEPTGQVDVAFSFGSNATTSISGICFVPTSATGTGNYAPCVDWNGTTTVTVSAIDDLIDEDLEVETLTITASSTDSNFDGLISLVSVDVDDNDTASVDISDLTVTFTEGDVDGLYTIFLDTQPTATTTINVTQIGSLVFSSTTTLEFTENNYSIPQTVSFNVIDRLDFTGTTTATTTHTASSTDTKYDGISIDSVVVTIIDDEPVPSAAPILTGGSTIVTEAGGTDTILFNIGSQPDAQVDFAFSLSDGEATSSVPGICFNQTATSSSFGSYAPCDLWSSTSTVTLSAIDDFFDEDAEFKTLTITASSTDADFDGLVATTSVEITDNDTFGINATSSLQDLGTHLVPMTVDLDEVKTSTDITFAYNSEPFFDTTVSCTSTDDQVVIWRGGYDFVRPAADFATSTEFSIWGQTGIDEADIHPGTLECTVSSADADYDGLSFVIDASITDEDQPGTSTGGGGYSAVSSGGGGSSRISSIRYSEVDSSDSEQSSGFGHLTTDQRNNILTIQKSLISTIQELILILSNSINGEVSSQIESYTLASDSTTFGAPGSLTFEQLQAKMNALIAELALLQGEGVGVSCEQQFYARMDLGSSGAEVVRLQTILEQKGFLVMPVGVAKGYYGTLTKTALARYQASVKISPAIGLFGPVTRTHFNNLCEN